MSFPNRIWRLARGLGRKAGDDWRERGRRKTEDRRSARLDAEAEAAARAEVDAIQPQTPPYSVTPLPESRPAPEVLPKAQTIPSDLAIPSAAETTPRQPKTPAFAAGPAGFVDPVLVPHYATLGVPVDADFAHVERAYQEAKARSSAEALPADSVEGARARQEEAKLDEAFLALKKAMVAERRL